MPYKQAWWMNYSGKNETTSKNVADEELIEGMSSAMAAESEASPPTRQAHPESLENRDVGNIKSHLDRASTQNSSDRSCHFANKGGPDGFNDERMSMLQCLAKETTAAIGTTMTVSTLCCARNVRKKAKLTVLIVLNVKGETTQHDIAGRETGEGYP